MSWRNTSVMENLIRFTYEQKRKKDTDVVKIVANIIMVIIVVMLMMMLMIHIVQSIMLI